MKVAVFSHCAIDKINLEGSSFEQIGGAACYCGITARNLKFNVDLNTKFGDDFPVNNLLEHKIQFENKPSKKKTTRFSINISGAERTLKLENECDPLDYKGTDADASIITPIYHEITTPMFAQITKDSKFSILDPQGFLRTTDSENNVTLKRTDMDLSNVDAIKVNVDEMYNIVGETGDKGMVALQKKGVKYVLLTNKTDVSMLVKDRVYSLTLPNKEIYDTTGIGDIFCATFCCTMVKEKDFLWALCFAGGSAQAALDSKALGLLKIPERGSVETNASYFYNLVKYRQV